MVRSSPWAGRRTWPPSRAAPRAVTWRAPDREEVAVLTRVLDKQRGHYRDNPAEAKKLLSVGLAPLPERFDAAELAAWTAVARVLLNLDETITRE